MLLKDIILEKWKECFKSRDLLGKSAFESIKAKMLLAEKSGEYELPLSNAVVENIIIKDIKELKETQSYYKSEDNNFKDLQYKIDILSEFLPKQMSEEEVINIINRLQGVENNKGKLIGLVVKEVGSRFDKSKIAQLVNKVLQG